MKFSSPLVLASITLLALTGAGCSRTSPPASVPTTADPSGDPAGLFGGAQNQASKVPSDIPVYPGGTVIAVTGSGANTSVAQLTVDLGPRVIEWITAEETRRGAVLKKTSVEGMSTNLRFETSSTRYQVRVDAPRDGGNAFLTISKGTTDAIMGE